MPARLMLILCVSLAGPVLTVPASVLAGPAQSERARVRVVVDASALAEASAFFEDEVGTELRAAVEQAGYRLDDSIRADATVRVRISFFNMDNLDYQVHVEITAGAELVQLETLGCPQCVDADLLEKIRGQRAQILAGLERALAQASQRPPAGTEEEAPQPEATKPKPITALGGVGIGATTLGIGVLIAGGVEFGRGRVYDEPSQITTERTFVDHRPVGGALLGVGGVVIAAGVTMLVVDLVRSSKRQRQQQVGLAHPLLGPNIVGLGFSGQF